MIAKNLSSRKKSKRHNKPPSCRPKSNSKSKQLRNYSTELTRPHFVETKKKAMNFTKTSSKKKFSTTQKVPKFATLHNDPCLENHLDSSRRLCSCSSRNLHNQPVPKNLKNPKIPKLGKMKRTASKKKNRAKRSKSKIKKSKKSTGKSNIAKQGFVNPFSAKEE